MKYYLDSCIWVDYFEERKDSKNNIGEFAFQLLCRLVASNEKIIISSFLFRELEAVYSVEKLRAMTLPFEKVIERVDFTDEQFNTAKEIALKRELPKGDVLHALIAKENNAVLVTRDKHFQLLKDICIVMKPEEII